MNNIQKEKVRVFNLAENEHTNNQKVCCKCISNEYSYIKQIVIYPRDIEIWFCCEEYGGHSAREYKISYHYNYKDYEIERDLQEWEYQSPMRDKIISKYSFDYDENIKTYDYEENYFKQNK